jgi:hypothetical protein
MFEIHFVFVPYTYSDTDCCFFSLTIIFSCGTYRLKQIPHGPFLNEIVILAVYRMELVLPIFTKAHSILQSCRGVPRTVKTILILRSDFRIN